MPRKDAVAATTVAPAAVAELLGEFSAALLDEKIEGAAARIADGPIPPLRRIEIYRHNVRSNLRGALQALYPVILKLVGEPFFNEAADRYADAWPSRSGDLNDFGGHFAEWIAQYRHARDLPYLPDVARLEYAWHEVFHAADSEPFELTRLAGVAPEDYGAIRFVPAAALRLLQSDFPVQRIHEINQDVFQGDDTVEFGAGAEYVIVRRDGYAPVIECVDALYFAFLAGLQAGLTLDAIAERDEFAECADFGVFLSDALQRAVASGVIADFSVSVAATTLQNTENE